MSRHFAIAQGEDDFSLVPITPMGQSLAAQCRYHGDDLRYPDHRRRRRSGGADGFRDLGEARRALADISARGGK